MPTVNVYCRKQMTEDVPPSHRVALISIQGPGGMYETEVTATGWKAMLKVKFHDFEHDHGKKAEGKWPFRVISLEQAKEMLAFMQKHYGSDFVVHCDGGVSRSVATGCFMRDFLGYKLKLNAFKSTWARNKLVYIKLGHHFREFFKVKPCKNVE